MDEKKIARFWSRVEKTDGCWLWRGPIGANGYGELICGRQGKPGSFRGGTHRFSYELHKGAIPAGLCVMHACDVRHCVNPDHLSVGTLGDNNRDMCAKGRHGRAGVPGERHPNAILTEAQVIEMRALHAAGVGPTAIAAQFGAKVCTVRNAVSRRGWRHI